MPNHVRESRKCPHCGSINMGFDGKVYAPGYETCQVICECCGMRGPLAKGGAHTSAKAVELWNELRRREAPCSA